MYKKVSTNLNFVEREKETLKFWQDIHFMTDRLQLMENRISVMFLHVL